MGPRSDNRPRIALDDPRWRERFVLSAHAATGSERQELVRLAETGVLRRTARGVYTDPGSEQYAETAHLERVLGLVVRDPSHVISHRSAAAVWHLPRIDPWPSAVDVLVPAARRRRSTANLIRHITDLEAATEEIAGVRVTDLTRTVVDLARTDSVASAVVVADAGLAGVRLGSRTIAATRTGLETELLRAGSRKGTARARFVIDFADARSESPGESLSRLQFHRLGVRPPELQQEFVDDEGTMYVDFYWPESDIVGEFDGAGKYLGAAGERSTRNAIMREKRREDRLRRQVSAVVRWDWSTAISRPRLARLLSDAGVM